MRAAYVAASSEVACDRTKLDQYRHPMKTDCIHPKMASNNRKNCLNASNKTFRDINSPFEQTLRVKGVLGATEVDVLCGVKVFGACPK